jgi:hypothetical protein
MASYVDLKSIGVNQSDDRLSITVERGFGDENH